MRYFVLVVSCFVAVVSCILFCGSLLKKSTGSNAGASSSDSMILVTGSEIKCSPVNIPEVLVQFVHLSSGLESSLLLQPAHTNGVMESVSQRKFIYTLYLVCYCIPG